AAGSVVLMLLWVSYSSMIVFLGAEFTKAFVMHTGGKVIPKKNAVYVPGLEEEVVKTNSNVKEAHSSAERGESSKEATDNVTIPKSIVNESASRKWLRIAFVLWPVVSILFNVIPFLRRIVIKRVLGNIKNADAHVKSIRLSLLTHSCIIKEFEYNKLGFAED